MYSVFKVGKTCTVFFVVHEEVVNSTKSIKTQCSRAELKKKKCTWHSYLRYFFIKIIFLRKGKSWCSQRSTIYKKKIFTRPSDNCFAWLCTFFEYIFFIIKRLLIFEKSYCFYRTTCSVMLTTISSIWSSYRDTYFR